MSIEKWECLTISFQANVCLSLFSAVVSSYCNSVSIVENDGINTSYLRRKVSNAQREDKVKWRAILSYDKCKNQYRDYI